MYSPDQYVIPKVPPEPLSLDDVDRLFKKDSERKVIAEPWVVDLLMEYRAAAAEGEARAQECELLEYKVKKFMADASVLLLPGQDKAAVTWKTQKSTRLNTEALKASYPKLYKEFSKEGTTRPFRVNKFQLGGSIDE